MPEIQQHYNRLNSLKQRSKDRVLAVMRQWQLADIIADENALVDGLLPALFAEVPEIMADAIRTGNETGESILQAMSRKPHSEGEYDFQKYVNATLDDLQRKAIIVTDEFATRLQAEVDRLQEQDISDDQILAQLDLQDWQRENRGLISSRLWAGLPNLISGAAARIYNIASLAIRFGVEVGI